MKSRGAFFQQGVAGYDFGNIEAQLWVCFCKDVWGACEGMR